MFVFILNTHTFVKHVIDTIALTMLILLISINNKLLVELHNGALGATNRDYTCILR